MAELQRREQDRGIEPDWEVDAFMQVSHGCPAGTGAAAGICTLTFIMSSLPEFIVHCGMLIPFQPTA